MPESSESHRAYVGLGSNIDPAHHLSAAVDELSNLGTVAVVSRVYESAAVGDAGQPNYLNAAILLLTEWSAEQLCRTELPAIESRLGRVRDPVNRNAARTIDLDLVLFDDAVLTIGHRRIPDPDIMQRSFLAVPLAEVDAECVHPETGETLAIIAERVRKNGAEIKQRPELMLRPLQNRKR